ncbi:MAG: SGNH/GDSL hydrolase family protein [Verrucomicrobia bacterium]|nr:SGNH/GDSL hydrolase family protein [Verrucomicrobiota bacterium]
MKPRHLIPLSWAFMLATFNVQSAAPAKPAPPPPPALDWHDVTQWGVEGRAWPEMERKRWFDRLPAAAEGKVTPAVWSLSRDSAGMMVRFKTDATAIWAHYVLRSERVAMTHMPATGVSGVDLYARDERGKWRWVNVTKPDKKEVRQAIQADLKPGLREYAAYLPLYNGVESLEIGVTKGAKFEGLPPRAAKPIVFYGTSITHGACASRPGMVHTAILGRRFDQPVVNIGFSGNGRMDAAVGELLCKIDAAAYVIDCSPNMGPADVRKKCPPLVKMLRAARPQTPIVLVEDRPFTNSWIRPDRQKFHAENHAALRESYEALKKEGVANLFYIPGDLLLGDDAEGATDGSHPSDLGFVRQSDVFEPVLRKALGR